MLEKVYLLWDSYKKNRTYLIGVLSKKNDNYIFKYNQDAILALSDGCMLPFPYTEKTYAFSSLPLFFNRRINHRKGKVGNMLDVLNINDGRMNNDNFRIVSSSTLEKGRQKNLV